MHHIRSVERPVRPELDVITTDINHEEGSMVSEYGLVAVLGATIAGLAISWAKGGAITSLLSAVLEQLQAVVAG